MDHAEPDLEIVQQILFAQSKDLLDVMMVLAKNLYHNVLNLLIVHMD